MTLNLKQLIVAVGLVTAVSGTAMASLPPNKPTINLFSSEVIDNIRETGGAAKSMESSLQSILHNLDKQQKLFVESRCQGAEQDPGCAQIRQQLTNAYMQMIDTMEVKLPEMEQTVAATQRMLGKRIRAELGHKMTARDLQGLIKGGDRREARTSRRHQGRSMSSRFEDYLKLVSTGSGRGNNSLSVMAAELYLDSTDVKHFIGLISQEIARTRLLVELGNAWGIVNDDMFKTVEGVKSILFGEYDDREGYLPGPIDPIQDGEETFVSNLEL